MSYVRWIALCFEVIFGIKNQLGENTMSPIVNLKNLEALACELDCI